MISEWTVIQAAANEYLKRGMKKQEEVWRTLRDTARKARRKADVKDWSEYRTSGQWGREKRKKHD